MKNPFFSSKCSLSRLFFLLLLGGVCLLAACLPQNTPQNSPSSSGEPDLSKVVSNLSEYALSHANYPSLPAAPSYSELEEGWNSLVAQGLSGDKLDNAYQALADDWNARSDAYHEALSLLRSVNPSDDFLDGLGSFTVDTTSLFLRGKGTQNALYSPASLSLALSMLTEITDGSSRQQLLDFLGAASTEDLREGMQALWKNLYADGVSQKTLLASSFWLNDSVSFLSEPLGTLSEYYYASGFQVPMGTEQANAALSSWINENTGNFLTDASSGIQTSSQTLMMLCSTLYFQDQWQSEFLSANTSADSFVTGSGTAVTVDFMHRSQTGSVYTDEKCAAASLRFSGNSSMLFILPNEGISVDDLLEDQELLSNLICQRNLSGNRYVVNWSLPKFDVTSTSELRDQLIELGITDVFDSSAADFSPLITEIDAVLSSVQQAARVMVDEEGCTAAAYTILAVNATAAPETPPPFEMNLNRPFLFVITGAQNLPLFVGIVNQPNG